MRPDDIFATRTEKTAASAKHARATRSQRFRRAASAIALAASTFVVACDTRETGSEPKTTTSGDGTPPPASAATNETELPPRPSPPRRPSPLLGKWKMDGKLLEAVDVHGDIELRVADAAAFAREGYRLGDPRFTLKSRPDDPLYDVVDHVRPVPPADLIFDEGARASCLVDYTRVAKKPLTARLDTRPRGDHDGDRLVVTMTRLAPTREMFEATGKRVVKCNDLEQSPTSAVETTLMRVD